MNRIPCPRDCPQRAVGCRSSCETWAEHERRKQERYHQRQLEAATGRPPRKPPHNQQKKATTGGTHKQTGRRSG